MQQSADPAAREPPPVVAGVNPNRHRSTGADAIGQPKSSTAGIGRVVEHSERIDVIERSGQEGWLQDGALDDIHIPEAARSSSGAMDMWPEVQTDYMFRGRRGQGKK